MKRAFSLLLYLAALLALAAAAVTIFETYQSGEVALARLLSLSIFAGMLIAAGRAVGRR